MAVRNSSPMPFSLKMETGISPHLGKRQKADSQPRNAAFG
jgi:hypothetical protein